MEAGRRGRGGGWRGGGEGKKMEWEIRREREEKKETGKRRDGWEENREEGAGRGRRWGEGRGGKRNARDRKKGTIINNYLKQNKHYTKINK